MTDDTAHTQALDRFRLAIEAEQQQRLREVEDLQFQVPELQWPDEARNQRQAQIVNGIPVPARPMLSIPMLDQPIQLVLNQERQAHLGVTVHPLNTDANDDTAEVLQGLYRTIERDSRAQLARSWAFERATKCGRGVYRVLTEYEPWQDGDDPGSKWDQCIKIRRILRQESVHLDPFAQEPDWSDGEWAFVTEWLPKAKYERLYGASSLVDADSSDLLGVDQDAPSWIKGDKESLAYLVAEYWWTTFEEETVVDGDRTRTIQRPTVHCRKMNGIEWLEEAQEWNGRHIPLIPVIGRELIPFDGARRWTGIIGPNKDSQRLFNYAASGAVEAAALEPKAPFDVDPEEIEGFEGIYQQANTRNFPYLPRRKWLHGQMMPPLARIQGDTSKLQMNAMLLQQAGEFIHSGTGAFEPTLGQQSSSAKSGRAVLALQQQHDQGNSNWLDNLADISMTYEAKVVLDLIPKIYDRQGRVAQVLDLEGNTSPVMLNSAYREDPQTKRPTPMPPPMPGMPPQANQQDVKHYDLSKGRYGVSVTVGKAYNTRLEEGQDKMGQLFQAEPELFKILGDLYLQFSDFPGHLEAAERMKKMLPPQLQDQPDQAASQVPQLKAQLQQLSQVAQQQQTYIQNEQAKHDAQLKMTEMETSAKVEIERMKNATSMAVAEINARAKGVLSQNEAQMESMALGQEHAFQIHEGMKDRAHEQAMGAMQAQQAQQQAAQQSAQDQAATQQQGDLASQQSAQDHGQALAQGQQAADQAAAQQAMQPSAE